VTRDTFIVLLAVATAVCGVALFIMYLRRRQAQRLELEHTQLEQLARERRQQAARRAAAAEVMPEMNDGMVVVEPNCDTADPLEIGKICPACGSRYRFHFRVCERDNSELAALN